MEGSSEPFMMFFVASEVRGDQRISTPLNRGDRLFVHHIYQGDRGKDGGKFAQFIRPPAPIVNDISLIYNNIMEEYHQLTLIPEMVSHFEIS